MKTSLALLVLVLSLQAQAFADCLNECKVDKQECINDVKTLVNDNVDDGSSKFATLLLKRMAIRECKEIYIECKQACEN